LRTVGFGDSGGASRFFFTAKASRSEREAGLREAGLRGLNASPTEAGNAREPTSCRNHHPTVKPLALCEWLARLILPPARDTPRRLLVPFSGSGSEMIGALLAGWNEVVGIELSEEYAEIAEARLRDWTRQARI
jgi:site-specific DNA-methyltransferase (adenine-specific)